MKRALLFAPTLLLFVLPAVAQPLEDEPGWARNLSGTWYNNGTASQPCYIEQRAFGRLLFTNENGSAAWGELHGDHVWIPDWSPGDGAQGLEGRIRRDRIVWPDGHFWSRGAR
ncbi:MAG TPA: hypothetical protein VMS17_25885 [Gemmataceae bacterium]|nr:hypothetical protein [Gemmataceae bacterium]